MKRKAYLKGTVATVVMAMSMTVTSLPVVATELPQGETEDAQITESATESTETAVEMQEETDEMNPESGIVDKKAPTINSLTISSTSVTAPGTVEMVADVSDDISGVNYVSVGFRAEPYDYSSESKQSFYAYLYDSYVDDENVYRKYEDGKFHGTLEITPDTKLGTYVVNSVYVRDNADNYVQYGSYGEEMPEAIKQIVLEVTQGELVQANLKALTIDKTSVTAPGTIKFTAELDRELADFKSMSATFRMKDGYSSNLVSFDKDSDGKYSGEFKISERAEAGTYVFSSFTIDEGKGKKYDVPDEKIPDAVKALSYEVINTPIDDTQPPKLNNIVLASTKLNVPGTITFTVDATDDLSGVSYVDISFTNEETKEYLSGSYYVSKDKGEITADQYLGSGIYKISSIRITDKVGNTESYYAETDEFYKNNAIPDAFKDLQIEVINDGETADVVTSTISKSFLTDVKNAPSNAVINVDISSDMTLPKEIQDAIKGTNKVLRLNSNRIQWELKGSDITKETKECSLDGGISRGFISEDLYKILGNTKYIWSYLSCGEDLPGKALVRFNLERHTFTQEYVGSSKDLYIYHYDENNRKLDLVASGVKPNNENNLEFNVTTGGYYFFTEEKLSTTTIDDSSDIPSNTPDETVDYNEAIPTGPSTWEDKEGTEGFVYRLYNVALTRDAEEAGLSNWNTQLTGKTKTAAEVAQGIFFSEEFQNHEYSDVQYVKLLYRTMFGREADETGLKGWIEKLNSGMSREYVFRGFAESQEFENLCKSYNIERGTVTLGQYRDKNEGATGYVARLYTKMLGRKFEEKGIEYWCKEYLTGKVTIENIATNGFLHSEEFTNLNLSNEEFVTRMYQTFLNREPDEAGYKDWVGKLNSGEKTRDDLVYGFSLSQEFANLKKSYGL